MNFNIFRESEHLENYVLKELVRVVKEKYRLKKSVMEETNEDNVIFINVLLFIRYL